MAEILELVSLALIVTFILADLFFRARPFRTTRFWRGRALAVTVLTLAVSTAVALFWAGVFEGRTLFDLSGLGLLGGSAVGVLVYELMLYGHHRLLHHSDFLWRWAHQMHHSAESLDAWGAHYFHPVDIALFTTSSSLVFFPFLGLSAEAGAAATVFLTFNAMFQHANIRTPRWVGYFLQRPEMHGIHHQRGVHTYNFADLPVLDMLFGTYRNPATWEGEECGFQDGASARIGAMLIGRDVSAGEAEPVEPPRAPAPARPAATTVYASQGGRVK